MDSWNLTVVSLLAYTDPNEPFILYTDAYDITIGAALAQTGTLCTYDKYCGTTNDEIRRYVRWTKFMNAVFCSNRPQACRGETASFHIIVGKE